MERGEKFGHKGEGGGERKKTVGELNKAKGGQPNI